MGATVPAMMPILRRMLLPPPCFSRSASACSRTCSSNLNISRCQQAEKARQPYQATARNNAIAHQAGEAKRVCSTGKIRQTLNIGKSARAPSNLIISGAVQDQKTAHCLGVVCQTLPVLRYPACARCQRVEAGEHLAEVSEDSLLSSGKAKALRRRIKRQHLPFSSGVDGCDTITGGEIDEDARAGLVGHDVKARWRLRQGGFRNKQRASKPSCDGPIDFRGELVDGSDIDR